MNERSTTQHQGANDRHGSPGAAPPRRIDSATLLGAAQEVEIKHFGQIYRLRRTTLGKLILTK